MRIRNLAVMGALGALAFAGPVFAEGSDKGASMQHEKAQHEKAQQEKLGQMQGQKQLTMTVKSVDEASNKVTFVVELAPQASIKNQQQQDVSLSRLQEGDEVRASFDQSGEIVELEVLGADQQQQMQPTQPEPYEPSPGTMEEPSIPEGEEGF